MGPGMMGWHGMGSYYSRLTPEQLKQRHIFDQYLKHVQQQMMNQLCCSNRTTTGIKSTPPFPCGEGIAPAGR